MDFLFKMQVGTKSIHNLFESDDHDKRMLIPFFKVIYYLNFSNFLYKHPLSSYYINDVDILIAHRNSTRIKLYQSLGVHSMEEWLEIFGKLFEFSFPVDSVTLHEWVSTTLPKAEATHIFVFYVETELGYTMHMHQLLRVCHLLNILYDREIDVDIIHFLCGYIFSRLADFRMDDLFFSVASHLFWYDGLYAILPIDFGHVPHGLTDYVNWFKELIEEYDYIPGDIFE